MGFDCDIGSTKALPYRECWDLFQGQQPHKRTIKIKSVLGADEASENTSLEKLLFMPLNLHKPTLMF